MSGFGESGAMIDVTAACRTCMKVNDALLDLFISFKTEINSSVPLVTMLQACTAVQVDKLDGLSQGICGDCVKTLQLSYGFRIQAQNVQETFKSLLSSVKDETTPPVDYEHDDFHCSDDLYNANTFKIEADDYPNKEKNLTQEQKKKTKKSMKRRDKCTCPICSLTFAKKQTLEKHMVKFHKDCDIPVTNSTSYEVSIDSEIVIKKEEDTEQFKCPECELSFTRGRSLAMHMMKKHNMRNSIENKTYECDSCGKHLNSRGAMRRHMMSHDAGPSHQCPMCPKKFYRSDLLNFHVNKHNGIRSYECHHCNKAFIQKCNLKDHLRIHTGETPFLCPECGKGFNNSSNLRQHIIRHAGVKSFSCILCPKRFVTKGQLTNHISTHTGDHPYRCELCTSTFTKSASLKKHRLIHLGVKPYACDADGCKMRFISKDHLKRHSRIHTGEKPYRCTYCERAFTQSNDLNKHLRTHIGQNIYQCSMCDMRFRIVSDLKQHYPSHFMNGENIHIPPDKVIEDFNKCIAKPTTEKQYPDDMEEDCAKKIEPQNVITIKFNRNVNDKCGFAGDITIDITPNGSDVLDPH